MCMPTPPSTWQVGIIRNVEVELSAKLRDQREAQTEEGAKLRKWQARLLAARKKLAEGAPEGAPAPPACMALLGQPAEHRLVGSARAAKGRSECA